MMQITYSTTRADQWRCNIYVMFHRPQTAFGFFLTPALLAIFLVYSLPPAEKNVRALLLTFLITVGGWAAFNALLLHAMILKRLPTPTTWRVCTTLITPEFFRDTVPEKVMQYSWAQITDIRLHDGDFYFWLGGTKGNFIPRGAFENPREGQQFFDTAVSYWQSAKSGRTIAPPSEGVWPPPPRVG